MHILVFLPSTLVRIIKAAVYRDKIECRGKRKVLKFDCVTHRKSSLFWVFFFSNNKPEGLTVNEINKTESATVTFLQLWAFFLCFNLSPLVVYFNVGKPYVG